MSWVNYLKLAADQQREVLKVHSRRLDEAACRDRMFWVRRDGGVSRQKGHWRLTTEAAARMSKEIAQIYDHRFSMLDPPGKGSLREWKPGATFGLDKIPLEGLKK